MRSLPPDQRLEVMELVSAIAARAATNHNVTHMIEFQELLVERLYRKMSALLLEDLPTDDDRYND
ncbi:MAG: hypothetical protein V2I24_09570 [Halieaceae bacterium]|nr:hypothetical protein [Halieaceae bacterium]